MERLFNPESIAVIGASNEKGSIGYTIFKNLLNSFKGELFAVNPNHPEIQGKKSYRSIKEINREIDLAIIAVPAKIVPKVLEECIEAKTKYVIIISAGFSEVGNMKLAKELEEIAKKSKKMRILGPNCFGILNIKHNLNATFIDSSRTKIPEAGGISLVSQSGALGISLLDLIAKNRGGIAKFASYGNAMDISEVELIDFLAKDRDTSVIAIYIEGTKNGKEFLRALKEASAKKPLIVLKGGKFEETSKATLSHTGSLAGKAEIYRAAFKQAKAIEAENIVELVNFSRIIEKQPLPKGNRVLVITNGGGCGVIAADHAIKEGLKLAELSNSTKKKLSEILPEIATVANPLDLTGGANTEHYRAAIEAGLKDDNVSSIVVIALFALPSLNYELVDAFPKKPKKPILFIALDSASIKLIDKLETKGISCFTNIYEGLKSLAMLTEFAKSRSNR
ncbi:MAG: CoA-binding protein [Candidatus Diapherotrites archaeon]|nr:CoA-binding protein [Candidatus Diapherotrites archaeon]